MWVCFLSLVAALSVPPVQRLFWGEGALACIYYPGAQPGFSTGEGPSSIFLYSGKKGAKNQPNVRLLPYCRLARSSHIAKFFRTHAAKMQMTKFYGRNPENLVLGRCQGEGPAPRALPLGAPLILPDSQRSPPAPLNEVVGAVADSEGPAG